MIFSEIEILEPSPRRPLLGHLCFASFKPVLIVLLFSRASWYPFSAPEALIDVYPFSFFFSAPFLFLSSPPHFPSPRTFHLRSTALKKRRRVHVFLRPLWPPPHGPNRWTRFQNRGVCTFMTLRDLPLHAPTVPHSFPQTDSGCPYHQTERMVIFSSAQVLVLAGPFLFPLLHDSMFLFSASVPLETVKRSASVSPNVTALCAGVSLFLAECSTFLFLQNLVQ